MLPIVPIHAMYSLTYEMLSARYGPPDEQNRWSLDPHQSGRSQVHVVLDPRFVGHARVWLFDPAHSGDPLYSDIHSPIELDEVLKRISGSMLAPA